ncbi:endothelin-converting enzyme-like 1 [Musca autumnalis]|uniref:endothelin-converting enzyme-like 1 n=1 Tax=Musca autumnalis TaxID=221902 RepID=UPI003CED39D4
MAKNIFFNLNILMFFLPVLISLLKTIHTEQCHHHSSNPNCQQLEKIKLSMDTSQEPYFSFYEYACGNWDSQHEYTNAEQMVDDKMNLELIKIVETLDEDHLKMDFFNKTYVYYKSCVSANGRNAMREYLSVIKPGRNLQWPILWKFQDGNVDKPWPVDEFDMYDLLGRLLYYGVEHFLIKPLVKETFNETLLLLDYPEYNILSVAVMKKLLKQLGVSSDTASKYAQQLSAAQSIWQRRTKEYLKRHQSSYLNSIMNYKDLKENYPKLYKYVKSSRIWNIKKHAKVEILNVEYFIFLNENMRTDPEKEVLCNIVMLHMLHDLEKKNGGSMGPFSKRDCIKRARHKFDLLMTFLYYEKVYKPNEKNKYPDIKIMFHQAKDSLLRLLNDYSENVNVEYLRSHYGNMSFNFGNQPSTVRNSYVHRLFAEIPQLKPDNFYYNHLKLLRHKIRTSLKRLDYRTHVMYSSQHRIGYSSTPFYDARLNMVLLPFGILQPPIYDPELHPIFKWSTLGVLMANTFFHSSQL